MGLWEADGKIVGIAAYEMNIGKAHLHTAPEYRRLLPELLDWAEKELSAEKDGKRTLGTQSEYNNSGYTRLIVL